MLDIQHIEERWHGEFIIPMSAPQTGRAKTILDKILSGCRRDPERGCWTWFGGTSGNGRGGGYGRVNVDGGTMAVHRVMFTLFHGPIPPRKQIDHKCRNRLRDLCGVRAVNKQASLAAHYGLR